MKKGLNDINVSGKKVLLRVDFNVPMKDGIITNDNRIASAIPTIKHLISQGGKLILFSHLGRVESEEDKKGKSLAPVAAELSKQLKQDVKFIAQTRGIDLEDAIDALNDGEVLMFENTRFEDVINGELIKNESKNNDELGKYWASLGDVFVNDAFGTCHRAHASNVGIASNISESVLGFLVEKEATALEGVLNNPERPFVAIVGGAKVSDKIAVVENLLRKADKVLIGGGMAFTFLKALGHNVGTSLLEADQVELAKKYIEEFSDKLILPIDSACASTFANEAPVFTEGRDVPEGMMGLDIGTKSIDIYVEALKGAKTVVWNGPMGVTEFDNFERGTAAVGKAIANEEAYSLIGGGDSVAAAYKLGLENDFSHISTGGGASLTYLEGKVLPGIDAIQNK